MTRHSLGPSPYASPLVYTRRGKDPCHPPRCPHNKTSRGPHLGPLSLLRGVDALPHSSSCGNAAFDADLVKPRAKRPRDTAKHPNSSLVFPTTPQSDLDLPGVARS